MQNNLNLNTKSAYKFFYISMKAKYRSLANIKSTFNTFNIKHSYLTNISVIYIL